MTIVTKPNIKQASEKKVEKTLGKPLVANEIPGGEYVDHTVLDPNGEDVEAWLSSSARRRVSTATTICVFITALVVMSIGIIGGVYLYRQFSQHQMTRFRGWCGVPYERDAFHLIATPKLALSNNPRFSNRDGIKKELISDASLFKEEFDLDLQDESYELIHVPDFGFGRQGRFIHDFKANKTGIIDMSSGRCFVMPLDRSHVLPPRTVFDLVQKMWMGYYNIDTEVIRETMRVVYPPVEDYHSLGRYISQHCSNYPTFRLERIEKPELRKRSVDALKEKEEFALVEFAGNKILHYVIEDEHPTTQ